MDRYTAFQPMERYYGLATCPSNTEHRVKMTKMAQHMTKCHKVRTETCPFLFFNSPLVISSGGVSAMVGAACHATHLPAPAIHPVTILFTAHLILSFMYVAHLIG